VESLVMKEGGGMRVKRSGRGELGDDRDAG
jgi:hypothetical protein